MSEFKQELELFDDVRIQFSHHTDKIQLGENEYEEIRSYSANLIFNEKFIVQLSGNDEEAHKAYVPDSSEQYFNDADYQDEMCYHEDFDHDLINELLEYFKIENNFNYLNENRDRNLDL